MKVPTKKKRNPATDTFLAAKLLGLDESPYEKVGKSAACNRLSRGGPCLNESPYEKVGKLGSFRNPPRRVRCLNESPYEKVGKSYT